MEQVFTREFGFMLGGGRSKPSLGSLGICWEWDGASFHWGVWVVLGGGRSKPSLGDLGICWEGGRASFTREFGYMLGARRSKSSLGIWMENFVLPRMPVFSCIGRAKQAFTKGEQAFSWEFGRKLCVAVRSYISEYTDDLRTQL